MQSSLSGLPCVDALSATYRIAMFSVHSYATALCSVATAFD